MRLACAVGASRRRTGKHRRREAGADAIIGRCCRPKRASISQVRCKGRIVYGRGRAVPPVNQLVKFCVKETHNGERTPERRVGDEAVGAVTTRLLSYPFTTTRRIPPCSWKLTKYCSGIEDATNSCGDDVSSRHETCECEVTFFFNVMRPPLASRVKTTTTFTTTLTRSLLESQDRHTVKGGRKSRRDTRGARRRAIF